MDEIIALIEDPRAMPQPSHRVSARWGVGHVQNRRGSSPERDLISDLQSPEPAEVKAQYMEKFGTYSLFTKLCIPTSCHLDPVASMKWFQPNLETWYPHIPLKSLGVVCQLVAGSRVRAWLCAWQVYFTIVWRVMRMGGVDEHGCSS